MRRPRKRPGGALCGRARQVMGRARQIVRKPAGAGAGDAGEARPGHRTQGRTLLCKEEIDKLLAETPDKTPAAKHPRPPALPFYPARVAPERWAPHRTGSRDDADERSRGPYSPREAVHGDAGDVRPPRLPNPVHVDMALQPPNMPGRRARAARPLPGGSSCARVGAVLLVPQKGYFQYLFWGIAQAFRM